MRKLALVLAFAAIAVAAPRAHAEIGTRDNVPAATLLLPYFEVDLQNVANRNTLVTINNASATAVIAHVTLWTDQSIPTLNFDIYLTGYDVQTINLAKIFKSGKLPRTADNGADPGDTISPQGPLSQDINFPGASGPCDSSTLYAKGTLNKAFRMHLKRAHTGRNSPTLGGCAGANYGDGVARGYLTIDAVNSCNVSYPSDTGYFSTLATFQNVLWGEYSYQSGSENFSQASALVAIEACNGPNYNGPVGNGAGHCPFAPGDYTFYGRYVGFDASDNREPLATTFATRFISGGAVGNTTDLLVWRDSKTTPTGADGPYTCGTGSPSWFPLGQTQVVGFDEQEQSTELCGVAACFPLEAQRVSVDTNGGFGDDIAVPDPFGWLYLNLNHTEGSNVIPNVAQSWVTTVMSSSGRFSAGFHAIPLDNPSGS